jgi:hypothetical protein
VSDLESAIDPIVTAHAPIGDRNTSATTATVAIPPPPTPPSAPEKAVESVPTSLPMPSSPVPIPNRIACPCARFKFHPTARQQQEDDALSPSPITSAAVQCLFLRLLWKIMEGHRLHDKGNLAGLIVVVVTQRGIPPRDF